MIFLSITNGYEWTETIIGKGFEIVSGRAISRGLPIASTFIVVE
jgi:hypothetical protein